MSALLTTDAIERHLVALTDWRLDHNQTRIEKRFVFEDFQVAFAFMVQVAFCAERLNHHPDWSNSHTTVDISLTTHNAGGLTKKDFFLAQAIEDIFI